MAKAEKTNVVTAALNAIKSLLALKKEDAKAAESLMKDFGVSIELEKAQNAQNLADAELITDHWTEGQMDKAATAEEIKTGPGERSSGGGAEKMVRDYSNPTAQSGTTLTAEKLARLLGPINNSVKALIDAQRKAEERAATMVMAIDAIGKALSPAAKADDDDDDDDDEKDFAEKSEKSARQEIKTAKSLIRKARTLKADAEDEEDSKACKSMKAEAKKLLAKAGNMLFEARNHAFAAKSDDLRQEIRAMAKADDVEIVKADDDDDEKKDDSEEKSKTTKAKEDADGNQADEKQEDGNQADHAKSGDLKELGDQIKQALAGYAVMETTLKGFMDKVSGLSRQPPVAVVAKAEEAQALSLGEKITDMESAGELAPSDALAARDILGKMDAVKKGILDKRFLKDRIAKAPQKVADIFTNAA